MFIILVRRLSPIHPSLLFYSYQSGRLSSNGSPCPADEWTLCLFATMLAESMRHSSIKVYLSAIRSLHIEQGCADPLLNCLMLQRVVKGIKRVQGCPSTAPRLPVSPEILQLYNLLYPFHPSTTACFGQPVLWLTLASLDQQNSLCLLLTGLILVYICPWRISL